MGERGARDHDFPVRRLSAKRETVSVKWASAERETMTFRYDG